MADKELITTAKCHFGGDPELFITLDGKVVGSERAIPAEGIEPPADIKEKLLIPSYWLEQAKIDPTYQHPYLAKGAALAIVQDGVQVELQLPAVKCRAWFTQAVGEAFRQLKKRLDQMQASGQKFEVSFREVVDVDKKELQALSAKSRVLGCQPSFNVYDSEATIGVNPSTYTKRSAGGHIHLGLTPDLMPERDRLPVLLDVLLGNTSVLIDRDENAAERRKVYGRAGEFRRPKHGIEYRTLSNFWLRSKELASLVTGLARLAVFVLDTSVKPAEQGGWAADQALTDLVSVKDCARAINENNLDLARSNFEGVRTFLKRHTVERIDAGLDVTLLEKFDYFIKMIDEKGLDFWFPTDPFEHWQHVHYTRGWEFFLNHIVAPTEAKNLEPPKAGYLAKEGPYGNVTYVLPSQLNDPQAIITPRVNADSL